MTTLSPQRNFQQFQTQHASNLQDNREASWLTVAMVYAMAEMVNRGATAEQMLGARNFVHVLQNLWDKGDKESSLPVRRLVYADMTPEEMAAAGKKIAEEAAAKQETK
jgi:hypothetical protein